MRPSTAWRKAVFIVLTMAAFDVKFISRNARVLAEDPSTTAEPPNEHETTTAVHQSSYSTDLPLTTSAKTAETSTAATPMPSYSSTAFLSSLDYSSAAGTTALGIQTSISTGTAFTSAPTTWSVSSSYTSGRVSTTIIESTAATSVAKTTRLSTLAPSVAMTTRLTTLAPTTAAASSRQTTQRQRSSTSAYRSETTAGIRQGAITTPFRPLQKSITTAALPRTVAEQFRCVPSPNCANTIGDRRCAVYVANGGCRRSPFIALQQCQRACGNCGCTQCVDTVVNGGCRIKARYCGISLDVQKACLRSCGMCSVVRPRQTTNWPRLKQSSVLSRTTASAITTAVTWS